MSNNENQKRLWKAEKEQLRQDLANRPKETKVREIPITIGKKKTSSHSQKTPQKADASTDLFLKNQLGLH